MKGHTFFCAHSHIRTFAHKKNTLIIAVALSLLASCQSEPIAPQGAEGGGVRSGQAATQQGERAERETGTAVGVETEWEQDYTMPAR